MPATTIIDDTPVGYPMGDGTHVVIRTTTTTATWAPFRCARARAVAQRRRGEASRSHRLRSRHRIRASHGRHVAARSEPFARAGFLRRFAVWIRPADTQRLRTKAFTSILRRSALVKDSLGNIVLDNQYPQANEVVSAGDRLHHDDDAGRRDQSRAPAIPMRSSAVRPPAKPERRRISATPGSWASRRISSRRCGSATTITRA